MKTIKLLLTIVTPETLLDDIERLEKIRNNLSSEPLLREEVKSLFDSAVLRSEAGSWEKLLVVFNLYYSFDDHEVRVNILNELYNNKIGIRANELKVALGMLKNTHVRAKIAESA